MTKVKLGQVESALGSGGTCMPLMTHLEHSSNRRGIIARQLERILVPLNVMNEVLHRTDFARYSIDAFEFQTTRLDGVDAEREGSEQPETDSAERR